MVYEANDDNFHGLISEGVAIVDFYSTHCGPCRVLLPQLMQLENELPFIHLIKLNIDFCPKTAEEFRVSAVPTLYFCKDGQMHEYNGEYEIDPIRSALGQLLYE